MTEKEFLVAVFSFIDFGPIRTNLLLSYFKSAKEIWNATASDLLSTGLKKETAYKFVEFRKTFKTENYFGELKKLGIQARTIFEKSYPENLIGLTDAPIVLYSRGQLKKFDTKAIAIVGTRKMTSYGENIVNIFSSGLVRKGFTVVSGLALGIDAEAHRAAYNNGGRTIAVLASGLDIISPLTNKTLALEFIKKNGAIVSEYPLGHNPRPFDFPVRDRIISGLAKGVVVIEGTRKSGTLHTVRAALEQGRNVYAVPGQISSPTSEGPNYLIQNGAKLVTCVEDILEDLNESEG